MHERILLIKIRVDWAYKSNIYKDIIYIYSYNNE